MSEIHIKGTEIVWAKEKKKDPDKSWERKLCLNISKKLEAIFLVTVL